MSKKLITTALSVATTFAIVGCGGGSDSTTTTTTTSIATGTSQYLDSAVQGATYQCGTQNGTTDANGTFTFEYGQDCTFSLGNIPLRSVAATDLVDGVPVVETNITVARVLQSLDADGDPTNGITILPEVVTVLEQVTPNALPVTDVELETLVTEVENNVTDFNGTVVTETEAQTHVETTLTDTTKALLAGKRFYTVGEYIDGTAPDYGIATFNDSADTLSWEDLTGNNAENGSFGITVDGDRFFWSDGSYTVITAISDDYITLTDYRTDGTKEGTHQLYQDEVKAKAYYDTLIPATTTSDLNALIVGKTYYTTADDATTEPHVETLVFSTDGHTLTDTWIENGETKTYTFTYEINNDTLRIYGTDASGTNFDISFQSPITETDTYILFEGHDGKFYKTYAAAEADLNISTATTYYMLQEGDIAAHAILVGDPSKDKEYAADHTFTSLEANVADRDGGTWSIENGKLVHVWNNGNVEIHSFSAQPAVGVTITNETYGVSGLITGYYSI